MKLGTKIICGFILVLVFLCIVAFIGFRSLAGVVERVDKADDVNRIVKAIMEIRQQEKNYVIRSDDAYVKKVEEGVVTLIAQATETQAKFDQKVNKDQMAKVIEKAKDYSGLFKEYVGLAHQKQAAMEEMRATAREVLAQCEGIRKDQKEQLLAARASNAGLAVIDDKLNKADDANRLIKWFLDSRKNEKEFIISKGDGKYADTVNGNVDKILELAGNMKSRFKNAKNLEQITTVITAVQAYDKAFNRFVGYVGQQETASTAMIAAARGVSDECAAARADQKAKMQSQISTANSIIITGTIVAIVLGLLFAILITRAVTRPLNIVIQGLTEGASQVAAASGQVSSASQSLAEGSSQQAASIEETSSSMEEMSSMTKNNAESARQADTLMKNSNKIVGEANQSMNQLIRSMEEISKASEETSKIIKTIDEIAFQTNLLALNAAVEAARAGEAGAGFAVVAEEVRNLAMRAADAAKNTASLIEGTVRKVTEGSEIVTATNSAFAKVVDSSEKVGELIAEISGASDEQSKGIEQVNLAISEMDKVVQQNAANAEESASASEEMNAQAEQLREYVGELMKMVSGKKDLALSKTGGSRGRHPKVKSVAYNQKAGGSKKKNLPASSKREIRPDQVIPFDDDDFDDF